MLTTLERLRILSRLFTRPVFASLAVNKDWKRSVRFLEEYRLIEAGPPVPLRELFEGAWDEIRRGYRNEYVYKNEIASRLIFGRHSPRTAAMHVELPVGRSIVDIAIFNGTSTAYEVKTEFDSAKRLATQTADYAKVFEHVYVVTTPTLSSRYLEAVGETVGVYALSSSGSLSLVKEAGSNRQKLIKNTVFRCLRQHEYLSILKECADLEVNVPNGLVSNHCSALFEKLTEDEVHNSFIKAMRARKIGLQTAEFVTSLPPSLRALGYATPLSGRQQAHLAAVLDHKVGFVLT